jgi:ABC-type transporter Mla MlaB component
MDYCVTFEVSPPSFEALPSPKGGAGAAAHGAMAAEQRFMLPAVVEGDIRNLLEAIESYAAMDPRAPVVLDCARLVRIEFAAAASLHATLRRLAADERRIELRELNHLVAALLRLLNYGDCARLYAHKY